MDIGDAAWKEVRRFSGLSGEAKLAWRYVWKELLRSRPGSEWVTYCELGADQGTDARSGRRAIDRLAQHGLVEVMERLPGRVRVYVWDPREVCQGRDRTPDANRPLLATMDEDSPAAAPELDVHRPEPPGSSPPSAADLAQHPPAVVAQQTPPRARATLGSKGFINNPNPSVPSEPFEQEKVPKARRSGTGPADPAQQPPPTSDQDERNWLAQVEAEARARLYDGPQPLAASVAVVAGRAMLLPGQRERTQAVESLIARICQRVPKLVQSPALRIANAIVDGELPQRELDDALTYLDQQVRAGQLRLEPWKCFVGTMRKVFRRHGLHWPTAPGPDVAHSQGGFDP